MAKNFLSKYRNILIPALWLIAVFILATNFANNRKNVNEAILAEVELDIRNSLDREHQKTLDSLREIKEWKIARLRGVGNGLSTFALGIMKLDECDTCSSFRTQNPSNTKTKYFVKLPGYTLSPGSLFLIDKHKYLQRYFVKDKESTSGVSIVHLKEKQIA